MMSVHYLSLITFSTCVAAQNDKSTPLHLACTQGALEVVKLMLCSFDRVEDIINITDGACQTPLHRLVIGYIYIALSCSFGRCYDVLSLRFQRKQLCFLFLLVSILQIYGRFLEQNLEKGVYLLI